MATILTRLRTWYAGADRQQKMVMVGGGLFFAFLLAGTLYFASRPRMAMLFGALDPAQQASVVTELQKDGIQVDFDDRGNIMVPSNEVASARVKLAAANKLPQTTAFGDTQLASLGIMNTPPVERERLKTILEGRLAETINAINGVSNATVNLALPQSSPFVRDQEPATASITVSDSDASGFGSDQGRTIALIVANSVPGLTLNNVTVVDNHMNVLYDGTHRNSINGRIGDRLTTEQTLARQKEQELQADLDKIYGPNAAIVHVNLALDFDDKSYVETKEVPSDKLETSKVKETMDGGTGAPGGLGGGIAGTSSNIGTPASQAQVGGDGKKYTMTQSQNDYLTDTTQTKVQEAPGTLQSMSIDVVANSSKVTDPTKIKSIIDGYMGANLNQPGFTDSVTLEQFDTSAVAADAAQAKAAAMQQRIQQLISLLPVIALLVVAVLVVKQIGKLGKSMPMALEGAGYGSPMMMMPSDGLPLEAGAARLAVSAHEAQSSASSLPQGVLGGDAPDDDSLDIKSIGKKVNVPLEQIRKMSDDRPEAVAMLIKGWLLEDQR